MATLPSATARYTDVGAGVAVDVNLMAIFSCSQSGTAGTVRYYTKVQDQADDTGYGEGLELAAHHVERNRQGYLFGKLATATAGAIGPVDVTGVTGTSVVTFTGTPYDDEHIIVDVVTGGTIATAGIEIKVSRDGGRTYGGTIRLGTATSYAIPNSGVTVNFAAGTLVAGDSAIAYCSSPKWNAAGLAVVFDALKAQTKLPRIIVLCGDVDEATDVQSVIDEIEAYETEADRRSVVLCQLRDWYAPAKMQGEPSDLDFDGTAHTITRNTGSWVTDGFKVGMTVVVAGTASGTNDGTAGVLTTVTATVLTFASGLATQANQDGATVTISATETKSTWRSALETIVGSTPSTQKIADKVMACGGRARRKSPINSTRKRRNAAWPIAIRCMGHDIQVSPAEVALGGLEGWDIFDNDGVLEEHDERVDGGLLGSRIASLRTFNSLPGIYCSLPLTLDNDNQPLSRLPIVLVAQLATNVCQAQTTLLLNGRVLLNTDGTPQEAEARRINAAVLGALEDELLTKKREGQRASAVTFAIDKTVDLRVVGAEVPWEATVTALGYLEQIAGTVRVGG